MIATLGRPAETTVAVVSRRSKRRRSIRLALLAAVMLVITGLDYMRIASVPVWLIAEAAMGVYVVAIPARLRRLRAGMSRVGPRVVLPAVVLAVIAVVSHASLSESGAGLSRVAWLDICAIGIVLLVGTLASEYEPADIVVVVAIIAGTEALIALLQFVGFEWAWTLPSRLGGSQPDLPDAGLVFENVGRARGLHLYVHKFAAMQAMLGAFLVACTLTRRRDLGLSRKRSAFVFAATTITVMSGVVAFSRSVIVGVGLTLVVGALLGVRGASRRVRAVIVVGAGVPIVAAIFAWLNVSSGKQFYRIANFFDQGTTNDSLRLEGLREAWAAFRSAPIAGVGFDFIPTSGLAVHSVPVRILAAYGLVGFAVYAACTVGIVSLLVSARRRSPTLARRAFAAAAVCAIAAGLFDASTHSSGFLVADISKSAVIGLMLGGAAWPPVAMRSRT